MLAGRDLVRFLSVMRLSHTGGWCPRGGSLLPPSWRICLGRKGRLCCNFPSWISIYTSKTLCQPIFFPEHTYEEDTNDNQRDPEVYFTSAIRWHLHCHGFEFFEITVVTAVLFCSCNMYFLCRVNTAMIADFFLHRGICRLTWCHSLVL